MTLLKVAFRNIFRHRTRSLITLAGIAFGSVAIIFIAGFFGDTLHKMREGYIEAHTGHMQIYRRGYFEKGGTKPFEYLIEHNSEIAAAVSALPEVDYVAGRLQFGALLGTGETSAPCYGQGVQPEHERFVMEARYRTDGSTKTTEINMMKDRKLKAGVIIREGRELSDERKFGIIAGQGLAAGIGAKLGQTLILMTHTAAGAINAFDVTLEGIFYTGSKAFDDNALRLPLSTAQQLLGTESVQALVIHLHDTQATDEVRRKLERLFKERQWDLEVKTWVDLNDFYVKTEKLFKGYYHVVILVICVIVILSIFNTINMSVLERTPEIGTTMAMGMRPAQVVRLFLYEGLLLGVIGAAGGVALGCAAISLSSWVGITMPPPPGASMYWLSTPMLVPSSLVQSFLLAVAISALSALYPAFRASRMEIAQALRHVL